jgi:hypothetical protein
VWEEVLSRDINPEFGEDGGKPRKSSITMISQGLKLGAPEYEAGGVLSIRQ